MLQAKGLRRNTQAVALFTCENEGSKLAVTDSKDELPADKPSRLALGLNIGVAVILLGTPIILVYLFVTVVLAGSFQQGGWPWPAAIAAGGVIVVLLVISRYLLRRGRWMRYGVPHRTNASNRTPKLH